MAKQKPTLLEKYQNNSLDPKTGLPDTSSFWDGVVAPKSTTLAAPSHETSNIPIKEYQDYIGGDTGVQVDQNIDDRRANAQSSFEKFGYDLAKGSGLAVTTFANSLNLMTTGIVSSLYEGDASKLYDNPISNALSNFNDWMERELPNYYTKEEIESNNALKGIIPFTAGSANFWFDKVLKNAGFTVGAIGAGMATSKLVNAFSKALATGEGAILEQALAGDVTGALAQASKTSIHDGVQLLTSIGVSAMGEASIEALDGYKRVKQDLTDYWAKQNPGKDMSEAEYNEIEDYAKNAANTRFALNTALLAWSDFVQFGKLLRGKGAAKAALRETNVVGNQIVTKPVTALERAGELVKNIGSESFEEGAQYGIEKGTQDYYERKYDNKAIDTLANITASLSTGIKESLGTKEGLENWILGAISGGLFGGVTNKMTGKSFFHSDAKANYSRTQAIVNQINPLLVNQKMATMLEGNIRDQSLERSLDEAIKKNDIFEFKNLQGEKLVNAATTALKLDKFDLFMAKVNDLSKLNEEDFKKTFGLDYDGNKKTVADYVKNLKEQLYEVQNVYDLVEDAHGKKSEVVKDKLVASALGIKDIDRREADIAADIAEISQGKVTYGLSRFEKGVTNKEHQAEFTRQLEELKKNDPNAHVMVDMLKKDLSKLAKRRENFIKAYNALVTEDGGKQAEAHANSVRTNSSNKFQKNANGARNAYDDQAKKFFEDHGGKIFHDVPTKGKDGTEKTSTYRFAKTKDGKFNPNFLLDLNTGTEHALKDIYPNIQDKHIITEEQYAKILEVDRRIKVLDQLIAEDSQKHKDNAKGLLKVEEKLFKAMREMERLTQYKKSKNGKWQIVGEKGSKVFTEREYSNLLQDAIDCKTFYTRQLEMYTTRQAELKDNIDFFTQEKKNLQESQDALDLERRAYQALNIMTEKFEGINLQELQKMYDKSFRDIEFTEEKLGILTEVVDGLKAILKEIVFKKAYKIWEKDRRLEQQYTKEGLTLKIEKIMNLDELGAINDELNAMGLDIKFLNKEIELKEREIVRLSKAAQAYERFINKYDDLQKELAHSEGFTKNYERMKDAFKDIKKNLEAEREAFEQKVAKEQQKKVAPPKEEKGDVVSNPEPIEVSEEELKKIWEESAHRDLLSVRWGTAGNDQAAQGTNSPEMDRWGKFVEKWRPNTSDGFSLRTVSKNNVPAEFEGKLNFYDDSTILLVVYKNTEPLYSDDGNLIYAPMHLSSSIENMKSSSGTEYTNKENYSTAQVKKLAEDHEKIRNAIQGGKTYYFKITSRSKGHPIGINVPTPVLGRLVTAEDQIGDVELTIKKEDGIVYAGEGQYNAKRGMVFFLYNGQIVPAHLIQLGNIEGGVDKVMELINDFIADVTKGKAIRDKLRGIINWGNSEKSKNPTSDFQRIYVSADRKTIYYGGKSVAVGEIDVNDLRNFLSKKYINVNAEKLESKEQYTDPISGRTFPTYKHYLLSSDGRQDSQVPVKVDIASIEGRQFEGAYIRYEEGPVDKEPYTEPHVKGEVETVNLVVEEKGDVTVVVPEIPKPIKVETPSALLTSLKIVRNLNDGDTFVAYRKLAEGKTGIYTFTLKGDRPTITEGAVIDSRGERTTVEVKEANKKKLEDLFKSFRETGDASTATTALEGSNIYDIQVAKSTPVVEAKETTADPFDGIIAEEGINDTTSTYDPSQFEEGDYSIYKGEAPATRQERQAEIRAIKELLPESLHSKIEEITGLIDGKAMGQLTRDARILLSDLMSPGTAYHEAFHAVSLMLLTKDERQQIYNDFRQGSDLSDKEVEEALADQFADYMLSNQPKRENFLQRMFRLIKDFINWLLRVEGDTKVNKLFAKIGRGGFRKAGIQSYPRESANKPFIDSTGRPRLETFTDSIMQSMTVYFFDHMLGSSKDFSVENFYNLKPEDRKTLYVKTKASMLTQLDSVGFNKLKAFVDHEFNNLINHHLTYYLPKFGIEVKLEEDVTGEDGGVDRAQWIESIKYSTRDGMAPEVQLLIATLPAMKREKGVSTRVISDEGMPHLTDFGSTFNILQNSLAGIYDLEPKIAIIKGLIKYRPEYELLLDRLKVNGDNITPEGLTDAQSRLQNRFNQQFTKTHVNYKINLLTEEDNYTIDANQNTNVKKILQRWQAVGREDIHSGNSLFKIVDNRVVFNIEKFRNLRVKVGADMTRALDFRQNPNDAIVFLNHAGIRLTLQDIDSYSKEERATILDAVNAINKYVLDKNKESIFVDSDISGKLNALAKVENKYDPATQELQFINAENETVYEITLNDYLSLVIDSINQSGINSLQHLNNPYTANSVWKKILEKDKKAISKALMGGIKIYDEDYEGVITSKLKHGDYLLYTFQNALNWTFNYLRAGDKKLEKAFEIKFPNAVTNYMETFKGYLRDELVAMRNARTNKVGENIEFYKDQRDKSLGIFDFMMKELDKDLQWVDSPERNILMNYYLNENLESIIASTKTRDKIEQYIKHQVSVNQKELEDYRIFRKEGDHYVSQGLDSSTFRSVLPDSDPENLSTGEVTQLVREFTLRSLISNIEQTKLITADLNFYDNVKGDAPKRFGGALGTKKVCRVDKAYNQWLLTNKTRADRSPKDGHFKVSVFRDHRVIAKDFIDAAKRIGDKYDIKFPPGFFKQYSEINEADAQGYITLPEYREFFLRTGDWLDDHEKAYQDLMKGGRVTKANQFLLQPIKPQYFGPKQSDDVFAMYFMKCSLMPLIPSMIEGSNLEELNKALLRNGVGYALFNSGVKVGGGTEGKKYQTMYNLPGTPKEGEIYFEPEHTLVSDLLDYRYMGVQLDVAPKRKESVTFGTQFRKLIMSNLMSYGKGKNLRIWDGSNYYNRDSEDVVKEWVDLNKKLVDIATDELFKDIGLEEDMDGYTIKNLGALRGMLIEALNDRDLPENDIDAVEKALDDKSDLKLLDLSVNKDRMENVLYAIVNNRLIRQKVAGDAMIQGASTGFEMKARVYDQYIQPDGVAKIEWLSNDDLDNNPDKNLQRTLKFYHDGPNGEIRRMQVLLPHWFKKVIKGRKELLDLKDVREVPSELLNLIGFRIPTQGLNSMEAIEVAGFLPEESGNLIIVPSALVAKSGSDYDIDKLNIFLPNYTIDPETNLPVYIKGGTGSKEAIQNRIIELASEVILSPDNFKLLTTANSSGKLKAIAQSIKANANDPRRPAAQDTRVSKLIEWVANSDLARDHWVSKDSLAIAARHNTFHVLAQIAGLYLKDPKVSLSFDKYNKKITPAGSHIDFSGEYDAAEDNTILDILSEFINAYVDVVKENFVNTLNAGVQTTNTWMYLLHAGVPVKTIGFFMTQPIILKYIQAQGINDSQFLRVQNIPRKYRDSLVDEVKDTIRQDAKVPRKDVVMAPSFVYGEHDLKDSLDVSTLKGDGVAIGKQWKILDDFIAYQDQATQFNSLLDATTQDTNGAGKNRWQSRFIINRFQQITAADVYGNVDSIINAANEKQAYDKRLMQVFYNTVSKSRKFFDDLFASDSPNIRPYIDQIFDVFRDPGKQLRPDVQVEVMKYAENDLVSYIMSNAKFDGNILNEHIGRLFFGDNTMAMRLQKILQTSYRSNLALKELMPIIQDARDNSANDFIRMFSRRLSKFDSDAIISAMRDLREAKNPDKTPNLEIRKFYWDLVSLQILQSGLDNSANTIKGIIPYEDYMTIARETISQAVDGKDLKLDNFFDDFFMNNHGRPDVVPRVPEFRSTTNSIGERIIMSNLSSSGILTVPDSDAGSRYPYVVVKQDPPGLNLTKEQKKEFRAKKIKYKVSRLFKRVIEPKTNKISWVEVPLRGNGSMLKEHFNDLTKPSHIVTNNLGGYQRKAEIARKAAIGSKVVEGDIFSMQGIPVIPTNEGGVHGAGLAQQAEQKGLIKRGNGNFTADSKVVTLPVKKHFSESMDTPGNMDLLLDGLDNLVQVAKDNPDRTYLLPLVGMGHGEGRPTTILPILARIVMEIPNIKLVIPKEGQSVGRPGTVRTDSTMQNLPLIKGMLKDLGLLAGNKPVESEKPETMTLYKNKLPMTPEHIAQIKSGEKTITNRVDKFEDGVYELSDGTRVVLKYLGEAKATSKGIEIAGQTRSKDSFAVAEGYNNWADFEARSKFSANFINGKQSRFVYSLTYVQSNTTPTSTFTASRDMVNELINRGVIKRECL